MGCAFLVVGKLGIFKLYAIVSSSVSIVYIVPPMVKVSERHQRPLLYSKCTINLTSF